MSENTSRVMPQIIVGNEEETTDRLEDRLERLERAIAALQDTRLMEERLLERVAKRLETIPTRPDEHSGTPTSSRQSWMPGALRMVGQQLLAATHPENQSPRLSFFSAKQWIVTDLIQEIRTFLMMYFDYRYRPTLPARVIPVAAVCVFLLSWLGLRNFIFASFVGAIIDYTINVLLVLLVYKTFQREAVRYKSMVSQFPPL